MSIRVLLVDDHTIMLDGLRAILAREADMQVVAQTGDGRKSLELVKKHRPDVVVMDVVMPGLNGVDAVPLIFKAHPKARVIGLSVSVDRRHVLGMLAAGVSGYLDKITTGTDLVRAIRAVVDGQQWLCPSAARVVMERAGKAVPAGDAAACPVLSQRQREVLQLLAEGHTSREIGQRLGIATKTVEIHRRAIARALNLYGVAEQTRYAIREGLTGL